MAELNFGLLTPPGSQSIGNAFAQGMDQAAVARAQENQNALSQYTLSKAKREDELNTQLLGDLRNATTNDEIYRAYQRAGKGDVASKLRGEQLTQEKTRLEIAGMPATQANTRAETAIRHGTVMKNEATRVLADPTFDNAMRAVVNFGKATGQDVTQELATITSMGNDPVKIAKWAKGHAVTGEQLLNQSKPPDVARLIEYRNSLPEGADRNAVTAQIENLGNQNFVLNPNTGKFEDRRQGQPSGAAPAPRGFVDPGIAQGVTPQMQMSNADEARRQAIAMDAANLPVNIRVGGNALAAAQPPVNNMPGAQPAAATTTPLNPRQTQTQYETNEKIRGSEREAIDKLRVKEYEQLGAAALSARKAMPGIDTAERILNAGFNTGWGTEAQTAAANILTSLGVSEAKNYATSAQLFLSQARTVTNDRLLAQQGTQTDNDFKRTEETGARLGNTADANKFLLAVNRAINKQTIEKHNFFTKWESKNNSLTGAEQAWQDSPAGSASLFDRPELKQYAQVKPAAATTAKPAAPAAGVVQDGYRFKGGNPAKVSNWEKVAP